MYERVFKRCADLAIAVALVVVLAPLFAGVGLAVWLGLGRPLFHVGLRAGRGGRAIKIVKFRSMTDATAADGRPLPDADRLTWLGRILRRTSLDELPQLASVIAGDMSLVGPRPLPLEYVPRYSPRQALRLGVLPGLTGWAQIHGRNALDWPARLEYDARYTEMLRRWYAPFLDIWIILCTILQVVWQAATGRGIAFPGSATMQEFHPT